MTSAYSQRMQEILGREMGEMGGFILKKQCDRLGIDANSIRKEDLPRLAKALSEALSYVVGREKAGALYRELSNAVKLEDVVQAEPDRAKRDGQWLELGDSARNAGDWSGAEECYGQYLESAESSGSPLDLAVANRKFGELYNEMSRRKEAEARLAAALEFARKAKDAVEEGAARRGLAYSAWRRGDYSVSLDEYARAAKLMGDWAPYRARGTMRIEMGLVHQARGEGETAVRHFREAIELLKSADDWSGVARAHNNIGEVLKESGKLDEAIAQYGECIKAARKAGNMRMTGFGLGNMAECLARLGRTGDARARAKEAMDIFGPQGDQYMISGVHLTLAIADSMDGAWDSMEANFNEAIAMLEKLGFPYEVGTNTLEYARGLVRKGDREGARREYAKAAETFRRIDSARLADVADAESKKLG